MSIAIVKKEEMAPQHDANGFSRMEMLPGTFPGAHNYKCFLKAGHDVQPEKYADKTAVYCFTAGKGYVPSGILSGFMSMREAQLRIWKPRRNGPGFCKIVTTEK